MNNRGFTLVEVIAVIAIIGILLSIVVVAVTKNTADSKKQAYEAMETSIYNAANNYVIEENSVQDDLNNNNVQIPVDQLLDNNYLDRLVDPNHGECTNDSYVRVSKNTSNGLDEYKYYVHLECSSGYKNDRIFPEN
ncbi:MAG: prepilin-type N-terminal cleavage/methylation domain-containing protein [Bacilli bacterium]|nr:prepilin-type N-terminal cleavage/methylation domain-containing protein [Bacilli bacterium]